MSREWAQANRGNLQPYKEYLQQRLQDIAYANIELVDDRVSLIEKGKGRLLKELISELTITKGE